MKKKYVKPEFDKLVISSVEDFLSAINSPEVDDSYVKGDEKQDDITPGNGWG